MPAFALLVDDEFAGQVTVNNIVGGSAMFASIGYWIDQRRAGQGHMPVAVALAADHCMRDLGLHRIEIAIRPENAASLRVVEKLEFLEVRLRPAVPTSTGSGGTTGSSRSRPRTSRIVAAVSRRPAPRTSRITPVTRGHKRHTGRPAPRQPHGSLTFDPWKCPA